LQITRVELKNIKNHAEAAWTFEPGVVAICGPNGAGKTTIIEAVAWALFDHLDYNRDDFVRRGAKRGQALVGFISDRDQREYHVHRDTAGGYFVYDPDTKTRLVETKNQVVGWLREHIGVEPTTDLAALFKSTIGVPQGTFTSDFSLPPAPRKKVFDQILKVEEYRHASDNLRDTERHLEARATEADRRVAVTEGELKDYDGLRARHDETAARLKALEREQAGAASERDALTREVARLDELQQRIAAEKGLVERAQIKLDLTGGKLTTARESAEQARAAAEIVEQARAGHASYLSASRKLTEAERRRERRDALRQQAAGVERELMSVRVQAERAKEKLAEVEQARAELSGLAARVAEQDALDKRIAGLREARGIAQSSEQALTALDRELEELRRRYQELSRQTDAAEKFREQAERADALEAERRRLEAEFTRQEVALSGLRLKRDQFRQGQSELARLKRDRDQRADEIKRLQPLSDLARKVAEAEARQHQDTERIAKLRAEVTRDAEMIAGLEQGGVCPLLTEKCLNLKPGESLDSRFRAGLKLREAEIVRLGEVGKKLAAELKTMRAAEAEVARLPRLREEEAALAAELEKRQKLVAALEAEVARDGGIGDEEINHLRRERESVEAQLAAAREAGRQYSQAEVLRRERDAVKRGGEKKRQQRDEISGRLKAIGDVAAQLAEAEAALGKLNDPRGRAAALQQVVSREAEWRRDAGQAEQHGQRINAELEKLTAELQAFAALDAELAAAAAERAAHERDYQAFIAHEKIAATAAARASEALALAAEVAEAERQLAEHRETLRQLEAGYDAERHRDAGVRLNAARERAAQLATQIEHARENLARLQTQLAYLEEVRERRRAALAERDQLARLKEATEFIRDILQKAAPFITEAYLYKVSLDANQLFREVTGRYDVTLKWEKDYEITLEEEGRSRPFANLSGGEQMAAALAVRLALLRELSEINIAFFDEPTTNMDEERRRNLAQQIGRIKDFHQLFVISHDDSFESYTDQVVTLGEKAESHV
jgi:DNA repair protein SbcC/Rad50